MSQTIVSTKKMVVTIGDEFVLKEFKPVPGAKKRYYTEKEALHLIRGVHGVPKLVSYSDKDYHLKISRLNGEGCEKFSDSALMQIRNIIQETIKRGVARHSLPLRDILVDKDDNVSIVDFERINFGHKIPFVPINKQSKPRIAERQREKFCSNRDFFP